MSAHTPGPWEVAHGSDVAGLRHAHVSVLTGRDAVAVLASTSEVREANARLIAAAPDLLAAWVEYISAQETIDRAQFGDNYTDAARARARQARAVEAARTAIAKAEGR